MRPFLLLRWPLVLLLLCQTLIAQKLKPGFDPIELRELMQLSVYQIDTPWSNMLYPQPPNYQLAYRSPEMALDNRWDLWKRKDSVAVISIRGTTGNAESWLENFYAGMVPAIHQLTLANGKTFKYQLASDSGAFVHVGWTIALAYLHESVVQQINLNYKNGNKEFLIVGHSQGGAIACLLTSYLHYERGKKIPADVIIKTYATAAPKPGNLKYAYDYDFTTRDGWAFRVVNASDWVPEVPFAIQTLDDLNPVNPFANISTLMGRARGPQKWVTKSVIRKMNRAVRKSERKFRKFLGKRVGFLVRKSLPGTPKYQYVRSMNYVPCGTPIILMPNDAYRQKYPDDPNRIFRHHFFGPYFFLLDTYYPRKG
jgi:hypothetical protein